MQTEIPEDVMKAAREAVAQDGWSIDGDSAYCDPGDSIIAVIDILPIARAIMAERERPAQIKQLEWFAFDNGECTTASVVGKYDINLLGGLWYVYFNRAKTPLAKFDTLKEAKADAQADYEKRVRSALVEA